MVVVWDFLCNIHVSGHGPRGPFVYWGVNGITFVSLDQGSETGCRRVTWAGVPMTRLSS